ncbi:MAG: hypothetical protein ABEJ30_02155 [Halorientalis sp.]
MRRTVTTTVAVLVVVAALTAVPAAAQQTATPTDGQERNRTDGNATVAPGERLAGVVGVQRAEIDGEIESRTFGLSVARAASDAGRAAVVASEVNETGADLEQLRERREQLREARRNGSISDGQYRARIAELAARIQTVEHMANMTANASRSIPAELLREHGVNATAIQTLRERASELGGREVAAIARSIAGGVGAAADRRPDRAGGPDRGNATDRGPDRPDPTEQRDGTPTVTVDGNRTAAPTEGGRGPGGRP